MSKNNDMKIATQLIDQHLAGVEVANPNDEHDSPDPRKMAASLAQAVVAKQKVGVEKKSTDKEYILEAGKMAIEGSAARCDQFGAAVCYLLSNNEGFMSSIELLGNGLYGDGTHCWVVCGRDLTSDINDIEAWGDDAFVVDVWFAKQYEELAVMADPSAYDWVVEQATAGNITVLQTWDRKQKSGCVLL